MESESVFRLSDRSKGGCHAEEKEEKEATAAQEKWGVSKAQIEQAIKLKTCSP
jgi:hypothetical protein